MKKAFLFCLVIASGLQAESIEQVFQNAKIYLLQRIERHLPAMQELRAENEKLLQENHLLSQKLNTIEQQQKKSEEAHKNASHDFLIAQERKEQSVKSKQQAGFAVFAISAIFMLVGKFGSAR